MKSRAASGFLALTLAAAFAASLLSGRYPAPGFLDPRLLASDETARNIVLSLRLPRALGALLLGAVLGGSGATLQLIFANPLVDAGFLGVSQGAAFGASLALVAGAGPAFSPFAIQAAAFAMSLAALALSLALSKRFRFGGQVIRLLLAGLVTGAFFSALLSLVKYAADPLSQLPDIVFWTMGSLSGMTWPRLAAMAPFSLASILALFLLRWRAGILSLDDEVSGSLGLSPGTERLIIASIAAIGVAAVTATCGIVAWVGLVVPQAARLLSGSDGRRVLPASILGGALFAVVADGLARSLFSGELPLGIVTALLGAAGFTLFLGSRNTELAR
jgi:iron complex transport system permease protein